MSGSETIEWTPDTEETEAAPGWRLTGSWTRTDGYRAVRSNGNFCVVWFGVLPDGKLWSESRITGRYAGGFSDAIQAMRAMDELLPLVQG